MARQYSVRALAELIADDTDTQSAAQEFGRSVAFIQKVQQTEDYRRALALAKQRKKRALNVQINQSVGSSVQIRYAHIFSFIRIYETDLSEYDTVDSEDELGLDITEGFDPLLSIGYMNNTPSEVFMELLERDDELSLEQGDTVVKVQLNHAGSKQLESPQFIQWEVSIISGTVPDLVDNESITIYYIEITTAPNEDTTHIAFGKGDPVVWDEWKGYVGKDGNESDGSANFFREIEAVVDEEETVYFTYKVSEIPGDAFLLDWYDSIENLQGALNTLGEEDQPDDILFNPETPIQLSGTYVGILQFTPTETGTLFAKIHVDNPRFEFIVLQINVSAAGDVQASDFVFTSADNFIVIEGQNAVVDTVYWQQGHPVITNFGLGSVVIQFYRDATTDDRIVMLDSDFVVSGEPLDEIVTLENFIDNGDGTGSFDARVNPSEIDIMDFMRDRDVFFEYTVNQPD